MARAAKGPAWRSALLRKGATRVAKGAGLPLPLVRRVQAGTAKLSAKSERKLYNYHRREAYAKARAAGMDSRTARRESQRRDVVTFEKRLTLIRAGASDKVADHYQDAPDAMVRELAKRYRAAVKLIRDNAAKTREGKPPTIADVAAGVRRSGRILSVHDLEKYVKPYQRGVPVETPSTTLRSDTWKMLHSINRIIGRDERVSHLAPAYRDLWEATRQIDVVASGREQWRDVAQSVRNLRTELDRARGFLPEQRYETEQDEGEPDNDTEE